MIFRKLIRPRLLAVAGSIGVICVGILIFKSTLEDLIQVSTPDWYNDFTGTRMQAENYGVPPFDKFIRESGFLSLIGVSVLIACLIPLFFILKDYYRSKSICTLLRIPVSRVFYYWDKLIPPLLVLVAFWSVLALYIYSSSKIYRAVFPPKLEPVDLRVTIWRQFPQVLLFPFADPVRLPAVFSFLILLPATVILFIFAAKSRRRGILSGMIACAGVLAAFIYLTELPASIWLAPLTAVAVVLAGIRHIRKIPII